MRFKHEFDAERFKDLHSKLRFIAGSMDDWCKKRKIPFVVNATWTTLAEDRAENRQYACHREKRAIDVGIHEWTPDDIQAFLAHFNFLFGEFGAVSSASGEKSFLVYGDERHKDHIHVQLNRSFAVT